MKAFTALTSVVLLATSVVGQLTINTPASNSVIECEPSAITWTGGTPPYFLVITSSGAAIDTFPATNATSYDWNTNVPANTPLGLTIKDSTGTTAQSAPFTVNAGTSTSCIGQPANPISSGAASAVTGGSGPTTTAATTAATGGTGTTKAATTPTGTGAAAGSSSSAAAAKSGAQANAAGFAFVGAAAAVAAALF
jgi:hypothetical protein